MTILFVTSTVAGEPKQEKIIPRFYELLLQPEKPILQDELDFFGGGECQDVTLSIIQKDKFSKSITPIWDFIRSNKSLFISDGISKLSSARILYSSPFTTTRLWSNTSPDQIKIQVMFPTRVTPTKSSFGTSIVIFTLGTKCYIDIGNTFLSKDLYLFLRKIHENPILETTTPH